MLLRALGVGVLLVALGLPAVGAESTGAFPLQGTSSGLVLTFEANSLTRFVLNVCAAPLSNESYGVSYFIGASDGTTRAAVARDFVAFEQGAAETSVSVTDGSETARVSDGDEGVPPHLCAGRAASFGAPCSKGPCQVVVAIALRNSVLQSNSFVKLTGKYAAPTLVNTTTPQAGIVLRSDFEGARGDAVVSNQFSLRSGVAGSARWNLSSAGLVSIFAEPTVGYVLRRDGDVVVAPGGVVYPPPGSFELDLVAGASGSRWSTLSAVWVDGL